MTLNSSDISCIICGAHQLQNCYCDPTEVSKAKYNFQEAMKNATVRNLDDFLGEFLISSNDKEGEFKMKFEDLEKVKDLEKEIHFLSNAQSFSQFIIGKQGYTISIDGDSERGKRFKSFLNTELEHVKDKLESLGVEV